MSISLKENSKIKKMGWIPFYAILIMPGGLYAYDHGSAVGPLSPIQEERFLTDISHFVKDMALFYSHELQNGGSINITNTPYGPVDDIYFMEYQQKEAVRIARTALRSLIKDTIEQVDLFNTLRGYGERLTSAQLDVSRNKLRMQGPSLRQSHLKNEIEDPVRKPILSLRSGISLTESTRIAPMIQAQLADFSSKLIYDPLAGGNWEFSLVRSFTAHAGMEMVYMRHSFRDQNILATFRFHF